MLFADGLFLLRDEHLISAARSNRVPFSPFTIEPHAKRFLGIDFRAVCAHRFPRFVGWTLSQIELRYTYLMLFQRSQTVQMPFEVTLRCSMRTRP